MKLARFAIACVAAAVVMCGCAPYMGSCSWAVPRVGHSVEVVGKRVPVGGECNCLRCAAPGDFRLRRQAYTLEFWNGDRWYARLYIRARNEQGDILLLSSEQLLHDTNSTGTGREKGFEYWMRLENESGVGSAKPILLTVSIKDKDGTVLGVENIELRVERRRDIGIETI
ncbi:MAG: hypothetical protein ABW110_00610 [Steroidobacteraceae bacterium]